MTEIERALRVGQIDRPMAQLCQLLHNERATLSPAAWAEAVLHYRTHDLKRTLDEDPFTARANRKPRGYPGDAVLLDYVYDVATWPQSITSLGTRIGAYSTNRYAPRAVRWRRDLLANAIDETAEAHPNAHVVALACGHLREAAGSAAVAARALGSLLAMDQDEASLERVVSDYGLFGVTTRRCTVRDVIRRTALLPPASAHLVYAAGLYDYLPDSVAAKLTQRLLQWVIPGGRLLIANFAPSLPDTGYMETFMEWDLIYRDEAGLWPLLADALPACGSATVWTEREHHLVVADMVRR